MRYRLQSILLALVLLPGIALAQEASSQRSTISSHDYPTEAVADYVFACMQTNGQTQTALRQCSCSFDIVASLIPYDDYVEASTYLSIGQLTGEKGVIFRTSEASRAAVSNLRRAQAEAEVRCF
ncbi:hypothetical protein FPY71_17105 [Aureimonas fodinaquatilis]|uniref:DUF5330 domain-containing protein n=1 Tax=Aureimonas fodinaquatilis TaxID=2565783 RepID=A0A5B0DQ65_9HYPH|nr:hypothetical protein [Aureimonas fodinaquatilis]KAA0968598.1 hypothetical protein FPY71_17105 [Aureimonas fodinaquatilis]